jgi:F-type H+-transporting ATPase subunit b
MGHRKHIILVLGVLPLFIFAAHAEADHSSNSLAFVGKVVNFFVLFGGLAYLLRKPLKKFLKGRTQGIERSIDEARMSRREADKKLQEAETRLEKIADEIEKIKKEAETEGLREKEKIAQAAQLEAERIRELARHEVEMLTQMSTKKLKQYTAELATSLASEKIEKTITPADQSALIDKSIEKLEKLYEKSGSGKKVHTGTH